MLKIKLLLSFWNSKMNEFPNEFYSVYYAAPLSQDALKEFKK